MKKHSKIEWSGIKKEYMIIAIAAGIVLMLFARTGSGTAGKEGAAESTQELFSFGSGQSGEAELSAYLSYMQESMTACLGRMQGVGKAEVFLTAAPEGESLYGSARTPAIQGVLIVAEGADDPLVVQDITEACEALFSISVHKIKVVKMKEERQ